MSRRRFTIAGMLTVALVLATAAAAAPPSRAGGASGALAAPPPPAAQWIPASALAVLEISRPDALLDSVLDPRVAAAVAAWPSYQKRAEQPDFQQFLGVVRYVESVLDTDWRTGLRRLLRGGVTLAVMPGDAALLVVDAADPVILEKLHNVFLNFARIEAAKRDDPDRVGSKEIGDVTVWRLGPEEVHAIIGPRLVLSNKPDVLEAALALRAKPGGPRLAELAGYRAARSAAGPGAVAAAFVNVAVLKQHPPVAEALAGKRNPMATLLFAGILEAMRGSTWLSLGLHVDGDTFALEAGVDGKVDGRSDAAAFAMPDGTAEGAWPNLSVPRRIAGLSLFRDLYRFYGAKDDLFPERTSGLIFFENMMGIFFSGRNLTEEVLVETKPEVRIVVAEQAYDPAVGTPRVRIPAFAAVLRVRDAESFDEVMEEAWQKALGLINFTRGQQAQPGLIIDRPFHGGTKFTTAYFSLAGVEDRANLDNRFNFRPSLAQPADYVVLSSTEGLARDLIDALGREAKSRPDPVKETDGLMELDGAYLAGALESNRDALVRQNMVKEGNTREEAELAIDTMIGVARSLTRVSLRLGARGGSPRARLELAWSPPPLEEGAKPQPPKEEAP